LASWPLGESGADVVGPTWWGRRARRRLQGDRDVEGPAPASGETIRGAAGFDRRRKGRHPSSVCGDGVSTNVTGVSRLSSSHAKAVEMLHGTDRRHETGPAHDYLFTSQFTNGRWA
jgi:hypothetical protein